MCFRPGNVEKPVICTECGNRVPIVAGFRPANCPKCGAALPKESEELSGSTAPMAAPSAPSAPKAPGAPN